MRSWGAAIGMMGPKFTALYRKEGLMRAILRGKPLRPTHEKAGFGDELATCVGTDEFGNRYYEDWNGKNKNQRRFVEFAENAKWFPTQGKKIAPSWQGWMSYMYDDPPRVSPFKLFCCSKLIQFVFICRKTTTWTRSIDLGVQWSSRLIILMPTRTLDTFLIQAANSSLSSSELASTRLGNHLLETRPAMARRSLVIARLTMARRSRNRSDKPVEDQTIMQVTCYLKSSNTICIPNGVLGFWGFGVLGCLGRE